MSEADEIGMRDGSSMSALSPKCSLIAAVASSRKVDFTKSLVLRPFKTRFDGSFIPYVKYLTVEIPLYC